MLLEALDYTICNIVRIGSLTLILACALHLDYLRVATSSDIAIKAI